MKKLVVAFTATVAVMIFLSLGSQTIFAQNAAQPYDQKRLNPTGDRDVQRGIDQNRAQHSNGTNISTQNLYNAGRSDAKTNFDAKGGNKQ